MKTIKIATDFSDTPLGRFPEDGKFNGATFRDDFLLPALKRPEKVEVDIDGVEGYGSSFLEEAFGGLVRKGHFTAEALRKVLSIQYRDQGFKMYHDLIWKYIDEAKPEPNV